DHWKATSNRPPSEASDLTTTYLAVRGLKTFGTGEQKERIEKRLADARRWLQDVPVKETEERVFRLWALKLVGATGQDLQRACRDLQKTQRKDGGWGQTDELASDAYATGSALVALHQAGGLGTDNAVYRRGVQFLIGNQRPDGSWFVKSRSKPFQIYFETGFPHGN